MNIVDLDKADPTKTLYVHDRPIIYFGNVGPLDMFHTGNGIGRDGFGIGEWED
jgi:hypothetical protein